MDVFSFVFSLNISCLVAVSLTISYKYCTIYSVCTCRFTKWRNDENLFLLCFRWAPLLLASRNIVFIIWIVMSWLRRWWHLCVTCRLHPRSQLFWLLIYSNTELVNGAFCATVNWYRSLPSINWRELEKLTNFSSFWWRELSLEIWDCRRSADRHQFAKIGVWNTLWLILVSHQLFWYHIESFIILDFVLNYNPFRFHCKLYYHSSSSSTSSDFGLRSFLFSIRIASFYFLSLAGLSVWTNKSFA